MNPFSTPFLEQARQEKYAVAAFDTFNLETERFTVLLQR